VVICSNYGRTTLRGIQSTCAYSTREPSRRCQVCYRSGFRAGFVELDGWIFIYHPSCSTGDSKDFALSLLFRNRTLLGAKKKSQQLDKVISQQYQFQIQEAKVGGETSLHYSHLMTLTATHGWVDENVAFFDTGAPIVEQIIPKPAIIG